MTERKTDGENRGEKGEADRGEEERMTEREKQMVAEKRQI